jgi:type VI secretion system secreted protein Hcp
MAVFAYLKFEEPAIKGGSKDAKHKEDVEVLSWNHSFNQPTSAVRSTAGGGTVEKANHSDFTFTKQTDSATDDLLKQCWSGKHIKTATFTAYRTTGTSDNPVEYLKIVMEGVVVSSFSIGGGAGDVPVENVGLNYATVQYTYTPQAASEGTGGGVQPVKHDLITGVVS